MILMVDGRQKQITLEKPLRIKTLLKQLDVFPEEVLVLVNQQLSTEDRYIKDTDIVEIIRIISSG